MSYNPDQPRDDNGRWSGGDIISAWSSQASGSGPQAFAGNLTPGSQDHVRAIDELATQAGANTDGRPSSPTLSTSLHNVARSVEERNMGAAYSHMRSAEWANQHEAGNAYSSELRDISGQLNRVPKQELGFMRQTNPLMASSQRGGYRPTPGPPTNPTRDAMVQITPQMEFASRIRAGVR